jgi:hypothetical protein
MYREPAQEQQEHIVSTRWDGLWWKGPFAIMSIVLGAVSGYGIVLGLRSCTAPTPCHEEVDITPAPAETASVVCANSAYVTSEVFWSNSHAFVHTRCTCSRPR